MISESLQPATSWSLVSRPDPAFGSVDVRPSSKGVFGPGHPVISRFGIVTEQGRVTTVEITDQRHCRQAPDQFTSQLRGRYFQPPHQSRDDAQSCGSQCWWHEIFLVGTTLQDGTNGGGDQSTAHAALHVDTTAHPRLTMHMAPREPVRFAVKGVEEPMRHWPYVDGCAERAVGWSIQWLEE